MPGIPTRFTIADLVFERLRQDEGPHGPHGELVSNPDFLPYAYLGAIGASWGDFMAARPEVKDNAPNTPYFQVWLKILGLIAGTSQGSNPNGVYRDLKQLRDTLSRLSDVIAEHKKFVLIGMLGELERLRDVIKDIQVQLMGLKELRTDIGKAIFKAQPLKKVLPTNMWQPRDTLHGSKSGRFLRALRERADAQSDQRLKAYALGATVGYGAALCGNPYINNVVGAPYRNHWWRHRWIEAYIDTWVYGYYGAGGGSKVGIDDNGIPNPLYLNWPNLCQAQLHKRIELPGISLDGVLQSLHDSKPVPAVLPPEFLDYWEEAYKETYGPPGPVISVDHSGLQSAYAITWLILWLQTSGEFLPCMPFRQINNPDNCGGQPPPWVAADGSVVVHGQVIAPPPAPSHTDPTVAEVVSGVVLAFLGGLLLMAGHILGGIAEIIAAVALVADGETDPDWDALRCYSGWVQVFLFNLTNAMHTLLKDTALGFPYTEELANDEILYADDGEISPTDAALATVRSRFYAEGYPAGRWTPPGPDTGGNWPKFPVEPVEPPDEISYPIGKTWPFHFVDGLKFVDPTQPPQQLNPLFTLLGAPKPLVRDEAEWNARRTRIDTKPSTRTLFGNAVDVSLELIQQQQPREFLDWDLDGDAGIGFPTWVLPTSGAPRSAAEPEP